MKIDEIKDFCNPYSKSIELVKLINSQIYYINSFNNISACKVCSVMFSKVADNVIIELVCVPVSTYLCPTYNFDDVVLSLDDYNKIWYYTFDEAKKTVRKVLYSNNIFNLI